VAFFPLDGIKKNATNFFLHLILKTILDRIFLKYKTINASLSMLTFEIFII